MSSRIGDLWLVAVLALASTGCAGGPSTDELAEAVRNGSLQRVVEKSGTTSDDPERIACIVAIVDDSDLTGEEKQAIADGNDGLFDDNEEHAANLDPVEDDIWEECVA